MAGGFTAAALLFDMDGVLVSSLGSVTRSWRRWAAEFGVAGAASLEIPHGTRAVDIVQMLRPGGDVREGMRRIEEMEVEDLEGVASLPGAARLLAQLPPERWAIVTSAVRRLTEARLGAAGLAVPPRLVCAEDVAEGKPGPEPYLRGAALVGFAAHACVVFEDAVGGVRAGKAAGCRVVGVLGTAAEEALVAAGADWIVDGLVGLRVSVVDESLLVEW